MSEKTKEEAPEMLEDQAAEPNAESEGKSNKPSESGSVGDAEEGAPKMQRSDGVTRRALCIGGASFAALMGLGALRYVGHNPLPRPPGGQDESHLVSACIRCERCYEACPRKVIIPAHIEDGLLGMRSPTFDFSNNYCDFCAEENLSLIHI